MSSESLAFKKQLQVGLGDAVRRVIYLHAKIRSRVASEDDKSEHELLMDALNNIKIDLGFDCDGDGIPDTIEIFTATAKTSCCRLIDFTDTPAPKKRKTSPRRRKTQARKK